jgi:hypothetical protein
MVTQVVISLFGLAVTFGVLTMVLRNPDGTNSLITATADTITGVTKALEGRAA